MSLYPGSEVVFPGATDETCPEFVKEFADGRAYRKIYTRENRTIMTVLPKPRYDLLKVDRYASGSVQLSGGCPFKGEFCHIMVTFGRRPRTREPDQLLEELEGMRKVWFSSRLIVDDDFLISP